mgnify:CR=1 FL=1
MIKYFKQIIIFLISIDKFILYKVFNFDRWHAQTVVGNHYVRLIIKTVNSSKATNVVEIGCGLGEIILNVDSKNKLCLDQSQEVLNAASFISKLKFKNAVFKKFDFTNDSLKDKHDVIIMVNWPHVINEKILKDKFSILFNKNLNNSGFIIIDTVADENYRHNHDINLITDNLICDVCEIGEFKPRRTLWKVIKKQTL